MKIFYLKTKKINIYFQTPKFFNFKIYLFEIFFLLIKNDTIEVLQNVLNILHSLFKNGETNFLLFPSFLSDWTFLFCGIFKQDQVIGFLTSIEKKLTIFDIIIKNRNKAKKLLSQNFYNRLSRIY